MDTKEKKQPAGNRPKAARSKTATRPAAAKKVNSSRAAVVAKSRARRAAPPKKPSPEVVYTQPDPFNRSRFVLHLVTVVAVVLALLFGMSIFFKVEHVTVAGNVKYTEWDIREASGIQNGENLLTISEAKLSGNIRSKLPYVEKVRIGIKLPDTVKIEIKELDVVYAAESSDGAWWLIRADGGVVEKVSAADAALHTTIVGITLENPVVGEKAVAYQRPAETLESGETVPVTVLASQQLDAVISILQFLEGNRIIGDIASLDVSDLANIEMWYGQRYQILLGDTTQLSYKVSLVKTAIDSMESYDSGVLDASLTIQPDPEKEYHVIYTPFNN